MQWLPGSPWKSSQQKLEHQPRLAPQVVTILKLPKVLLQVLPRNPNVSPVDAAFQNTPKAFDGIGMHRTARPLFSGMVNRFMEIVRLSKIGECAVAIRGDSAKWPHPAPNLRHDMFRATAGDVARKNLTATLDHAEHDLLVIWRRLRVASSDESLVNLDNWAASAAQLSVAVNPAHVDADLLTDSPRGFVGHAGLPLDFLGADAVPRGAEKEHDVEPRPQRRARPLERRASHRVDMVPAITGISRKLGQLMERVNAAAFWANRLLSIPCLEKVRQAGVIVWVRLKELFIGKAIGHGTLQRILM